MAAVKFKIRAQMKQKYIHLASCNHTVGFASESIVHTHANGKKNTIFRNLALLIATGELPS